jgi:methionyl-tRNA formyltransferase
LSLRQSPVKERALALGLEVHQPEKVKDGRFATWLEERRADVALVMAYGRILPREVLGAPRLGCINLHASLLPALRGAAPIQRAVIAGHAETGITLMQMDEGMDTGPIWAHRSLRLAEDETAGSLSYRLSTLASEVVREELPRVLRGSETPRAQDEQAASYAPPLSSQDRWLDFSVPATQVDRLVRGLSPVPGAQSRLGSKRLKIWSVRAHTERSDLLPGRVALDSKRIMVGCGEGAVEIISAQLEGRRRAEALELINGRVLQAGDVLGA